MNQIANEAASDVLKPCPFCGGAAQIEHSYREDDNRYPRDFWHIRASCSSCDVSPTGWWAYGNQEQRVPNYHVKQKAEAEAITAWNTRKHDPSALVDALRGAMIAEKDLSVFIPIEDEYWNYAIDKCVEIARAALAEASQ